MGDGVTKMLIMRGYPMFFNVWWWGQSRWLLQRKLKKLWVNTSINNINNIHTIFKCWLMLNHCLGTCSSHFCSPLARVFFSRRGKGGEGVSWWGRSNWEIQGNIMNGKLLLFSGQLLLELELLEVNLFLLALETRCKLTFEPKLS